MRSLLNLIVIAAVGQFVIAGGLAETGETGPQSVPGQTELISPSDGSFVRGSSVPFKWKEALNAEKYHLQVSLDSEFSNNFYDSDMIDSNSVDISDFPDNGARNFYWRVKAGNILGWGAHSKSQTFTSGCLRGDFTGDCTVDFYDLFVFAARWLDTGCSELGLCEGTDLVKNSVVDLEDFAVFAMQWQKTGPESTEYRYTPGPEGMEFVSVNDPGVLGHEEFIGEMSKYETTNGQFCEFLNAALESGDIYVAGGKVYGSVGTNEGTDYADKIYFETFGADLDSQIIYSGDIFSVRTRDNEDMKNHPVVEVSWYGAAAFASYYGYRLPTEWEWQAVADYEGDFTYSCGKTIYTSIANFNRNNPLALSSFPYTSPVDYYPSFGYGLHDMSGNVWEWTSSGDSERRVIRGGSWCLFDFYCTVDFSDQIAPEQTLYMVGFRVCR